MLARRRKQPAPRASPTAHARRATRPATGHQNPNGPGTWTRPFRGRSDGARRQARGSGPVCGDTPLGSPVRCSEIRWIFHRRRGTIPGNRTEEGLFGCVRVCRVPDRVDGAGVPGRAPCPHPPRGLGGTPSSADGVGDLRRRPAAHRTALAVVGRRRIGRGCPAGCVRAGVLRVLRCAEQDRHRPWRLPVHEPDPRELRGLLPGCGRPGRSQPGVRGVRAGGGDPYGRLRTVADGVAGAGSGRPPSLGTPGRSAPRLGRRGARRAPCPAGRTRRVVEPPLGGRGRGRAGPPRGRHRGPPGDPSRRPRRRVARPRRRRSPQRRGRERCPHRGSGRSGNPRGPAPPRCASRPAPPPHGRALAPARRRGGRGAAGQRSLGVPRASRRDLAEARHRDTSPGCPARRLPPSAAPPASADTPLPSLRRHPGQAAGHPHPAVAQVLRRVPIMNA
ncbi:hypothetical protein KPATCC21470_0456 [Kitasatospora purpeofusca]